MVRALLNAPGPVVIIGALWPDESRLHRACPPPAALTPHWEREVLDLAVVVRIGAAFSPAEQDRSRAAAAGDRRLALALGAGGYGLTQTLAAAPQLIARWQDAQAANPYGWAMLTAAMDAARLGTRAPLSPGLLRAAAPGYCTSAQQAEAPANWFEQALAYATGKLYGAAAALAPAGAGMGQVAGYTVADYLIQHASRERRSARVPASTWDALLSHISDPADAARLADSAAGRLLYRYAIPLYRHAADAGDRDAAYRLAVLLAKRGDLDELRARADAGDRFAADELAVLLPGAGDLDRAARPRRRRRPGRRLPAGRSAGQARRPGRAARPRRRRRRECRLAAGCSAGQARRPGRAARPRRRGRPGRRRRAGRSAARGRGPGQAARPRRRRRPGRRLPAGRSAGQARRPGRAARPRRRRRPGCRLPAGRAAGRPRRPGRAARPRRRRRPVRLLATDRAAGQARRPGRGRPCRAGAGRRRARERQLASRAADTTRHRDEAERLGRLA